MKGVLFAGCALIALASSASAQSTQWFLTQIFSIAPEVTGWTGYVFYVNPGCPAGWLWYGGPNKNGDASVTDRTAALMEAEKIAGNAVSVGIDGSCDILAMHAGGS